MNVNERNLSTENQHFEYHPLTEIPAKWMDRLIYKYPNTKSTPLLKKIGANALRVLIGQTVFRLFLLCDIATYTAKANFHRLNVVWYRHKHDNINQNLHADLVKKCHDIAIKSLKGYGLLITLFINSEAISAHFLPKIDDGKVHPTGMLYSQKANYRTPSSIEMVQTLVKTAKEEGRKVSIRGAGFSQGKHTLVSNENDYILDLKKMNHIEINPHNKTATVGGGVIWKDLQIQANEHKLALQVMQASNVFSVGGSISANCHGWDHTVGSLGNTINKIKIIDSKGDLQTLTPQDELFKLVVGGWGMFGVIVEVELQLTDNLELNDQSEMVGINEYVNYFRNNIQSNPDVKMHLYRLGLTPGKLLQEGFAQNYVKAGEEAISTPNLQFEKERGTSSERILFNAARHLPFAVKKYWDDEKIKCCNHVEKSSRNDIMHPKINATFGLNTQSRTEWLQEYYLPPEHLAEFIKFLGETLDENDVRLFNASVRYVPQDNVAKMGYAASGEKFAVVLFFSQYTNPKEIEKTQNWIRKVVDKLHEFQGTFYLPYGHFATQEQFKESYPQWGEVAAKKHEYDPESTFSNGFYEDYFLTRN